MPPPKHQCSSTIPCPLRLSEAGPNKGKSFQVPTILIACDKTALRAVKWIIAVFHSFKAHLNPIAIDADSGRVHPAWLRLYQNNLLIHLHNQLKARLPHKARSTPHPPPPKPADTTAMPVAPVLDSIQPCPPATTSSSLAAKVVALHAELGSLREKLYNYISTHEACCQRSNSPTHSLDKEATSEDGNPTDSQTTPSPPFQLLVQQANSSSVPDPNPPHWLTTILSCINLPTSYTGALYSLEQLVNYLPCDASDVLKLHFHGSPPFCLAVCGDRSLCTVNTAYVDRSSMFTCISLPPDPTVPTAQPH
ncbi:hypothetical protein EDD16DRAFT_1518170 [Pisolithus croceorrhizus]|nr:hypothetical protein EV401DRAFT_1887870 [Pisolithus croceorrhizus]KAI6122856.1 hypothetical protein EDD16DRAFT_1518170 [Pisolithus croceorrhizus]KAI6169034.1 hypothetical protein EDD17DRAFT_1502992 [Pisolithus thermaeus]